MLAPRTIVSAVRTAVYGGLGGILSVSNVESAQILDAIIAGAVLADYVTWMARSVIRLPNHIAHGCYDGCVNLLFAWFLFRIAHLSGSLDASFVAVAFPVFTLVMMGKIACYSVQWIENEEDDG